MTSHITGHVADNNRSVALIGFRVRPHDVIDDVTDHVSADKDGGHVNNAIDCRDHDAVHF